MRIFTFNNRKYGKELLLDAGEAASFPGYFFEEEEHATDFYELIFWETGSGQLWLDNKKIQLSAGMLIFISPFRKRRWYVNRKTLQCRFLLFRSEFVSSFLKNTLFLFDLPFFYSQHPHQIVPDIGEWNELQVLMQKTMNEIPQTRFGTDSFLQAQLVYMLHIASRAYLRQHNIPVAEKGQGLAHQFRYLLEKELHADYGVAYYARKLQTSRVTLNKYCNSVFGMNAGELIRQRLGFEIKSGLLYSNHTVNEIADSLGFKEPANLSRFFRKLTDLTPTAYRKMYQGGLYFG
jgi:AraC family transcriptional activator of pobA